MTKSKKEISSNDRKILNALMRNARHPSIELSKKTKLSRQTVQKTIRKLEKKHVIWGYPVIVDDQKNGFSNYLVLIKRTTKPIDEKLADKIISRKLEKIASGIGVKIVTSLYSHGSYDWIIFFMARDIRHAKRCNKTPLSISSYFYPFFCLFFFFLFFCLHISYSYFCQLHFIR